ncbi:integrase, catalytic region, zinc finger, CCHC-type containing protein [Tanacetum coccineum]
MTPENRAHFELEKEAIHLILTGIRDELYITVRCMVRSQEMWEAHERLQQNDNQTGQFGNQRAVNVVGARETVGGPVVQQSGIQCFNYKEFGHYAKECRKPKRVKDSTYHKEKMLLCKQAEKGVQLQAEESDWLADTDEEIDEQELEAHYSYMVKIQEVPNADSLDVDENKRFKSKLMEAIATLDSELTECKSILAKMHADLKYVESLKDELDELESDKAEFSNMYDMLLQECVSKDVMCSYLQSSSDLDEITELQCLYLHKVRECDCLAQKLSEQTEFVRVAHKTNVSRPQPRSNQVKDKVVPNTSHVKFKKTEVEEHPRISSISNQTKSVTAYVNARTKKPNVVPISTRKPKSQANKSVATPNKKTVASESTITSSKSYYRMLYKKTSKAKK